MKKIRILVADDEPLARRGVRQLLAPYEDMEVVGECRNGQETLRAIETLSPDLLFLDVQMPEMNGFDVIREARVARMPLIVFVTAHDNFAVRAFEEHALDYLIKPLHVDQFKSTMARIRERLKLTHDAKLATQLEALLEARRSEQKENGIEHLVLTTDSGSLVIHTNEVDWIEAEDYYSRLHVGAKSYLIRESLNSLESRLNLNHFACVHRSIIVRLAQVREINTAEGNSMVVLYDGQHLPVSRRNRAALNKRFLRSN
jgi:two-component system LytT family response regulator